MLVGIYFRKSTCLTISLRMNNLRKNIYSSVLVNQNHRVHELEINRKLFYRLDSYRNLINEIIIDICFI